MPNVLNPKLYDRARKKYAHMKHSAYKSGLVVQEYKRLGGQYGGPKPKKTGLSRWYKEKWQTDSGSKVYKTSNDIFRPSVRVTSQTPPTLNELSVTQVRTAKREKRKTGRVSKFLRGGESFHLPQIYWIRHAQSESNAVAHEQPWYHQHQRLFMRDPMLTAKGVRQATDAHPPNVDVVICSRLGRAIQTALLMFPRHTIYVVCGLDEWIPGSANTPLPWNKQRRQFSKAELARISRKYVDVRKQGFFDAVDIRVFETALQQICRDLRAKTVAVVGHSQWMKHYLGLDMQNAQVKKHVLQ